MDASGISSTNDVCCGRRRRVVLIPRRWNQVCRGDVGLRSTRWQATEAIKPGTPGRARYKP